MRKQSRGSCRRRDNRRDRDVAMAIARLRVAIGAKRSCALRLGRFTITVFPATTGDGDVAIRAASPPSVCWRWRRAPDRGRVRRGLDRHAIQFGGAWSCRSLSEVRTSLGTSTPGISGESSCVIAAGGRPGCEHMGSVGKGQPVSAAGRACLRRTSLPRGSLVQLNASAMALRAAVRVGSAHGRVRFCVRECL